MLVNTIYFHGAWQEKFPKKATRKEDFFSATKTMKLDFMRTDASRDYAEDDKIQVLSLKYTNPAYALNIFLPKRGFELGEILAEIDGERIQSLLSKLKKITLTIMIPKMKLETEVDLQEPLTSMGIIDLFSPNADLTGITKSGSLSVTHATHKAIIEMDEESTTAAAATQLGFGYKAAYKGFVADRPFLFVLTKSGHPLFMGKFT
ncbi:serine proteinase inhibitor [Oesophagostomum dentatum]|uniref:Serine proteinase inhibitor n=1 Tax=Oesophagostomum dentatum TaxID=61180 RepID=A0A0B1TQL7_OESDE|nr:serine proteinase inhibitor [Oesophagostomum dentatum]